MATDPKFFIESVLFIIDKDRRKVPFRFNETQRKYYEEMSDLGVIIKARKQGFSSVIAAIMLHACVFTENTRAVIVSHEQKATSRLLERIKYYIDTSLMPIRTEKNSEYEISFPDTNSTFYVGTAGQKAFGRGDDITHAHLSEFCFYEKPDIITSIKEAGTNNLKMVLESTANGAGTYSHNMWLRAIKKESAYKPHFFAWWENPKYSLPSKSFVPNEEELKIKEKYNLTTGQLNWRRNHMKEMPDPELFQQEYPACWEEAFLTSGKMMFDFESLQQHEQSMLPVKWHGDVVQDKGKVRLIPEEKGEFTVWRSPGVKDDYLITADASHGVKGGDFSVADVWDTKTWEQVAQFRGHINPDDFGDKLQLLGAYYNNAILMPETNLPGNSTHDRLLQLGYPRMWYGLDGKPFKTTSRTRAIVITAARTCVSDMSVKLNSIHTINECRTFILSKSGRYEAAENCFDDCVITLSLASHALKNLSINTMFKSRINSSLLTKDGKYDIIYNTANDTEAPGKNEIV